MTNIWAFLIQTITVSLVAVSILVLKKLLQDKLTPRWQYAVWSILALRVLLPVDVTKNIILPIPLWMEMLKTCVEKTMNSAFTEVYITTRVYHIFPMWSGKPISFTDWMVIIYAVGIYVSFLYYAISYLKLRRILKQGKTITNEHQGKLQSVCERYHLKTCKTVMIEGLDSAFVCSGVQPILVLPANKAVDEKVILHELLHLKYHDELQTIGWCLLRCLHWCNPFLQFVFHQIENDMETLCDQRVLELLAGEERRNYGMILLDMANEKYARVPGTSSISNGGKFISKRIEAIVRFKLYPRGMALVSVCSIIMMFAPTIVGYARTEYTPQNNPYYIGPVDELDVAMVRARMDRCKTMAGALDTYAKGLAYENGLYIAIASPYEKHEELEKQMRKNAIEDGWRANYLDNGEMLDYVIRSSSNGIWDSPCGTYGIYNIKKVADGKYSACLRFGISNLLKEDGTIYDSEENPYNGGMVFVPVTVWQEDGWVVEEIGERIVIPAGDFYVIYSYSDTIPEKAEFRVIGETGTVCIKVQSEHHIGENRASQRSSNLTESLNLDAEFADEVPHYKVTYTYNADSEGNIPGKYVGIQIAEMQSTDDKVVFEEKEMDRNVTEYSHSGQSWFNQRINDAKGNLEGYGETGDLYFDKILNGIPVSYKVRIYWDGEVVEELLAREVLEE